MRIFPGCFEEYSGVCDEIHGRKRAGINSDKTENNTFWITFKTASIVSESFFDNISTGSCSFFEELSSFS